MRNKETPQENNLESIEGVTYLEESFQEALDNGWRVFGSFDKYDRKETITEKLSEIHELRDGTTDIGLVKDADDVDETTYIMTRKKETN